MPRKSEPRPSPDTKDTDAREKAAPDANKVVIIDGSNVAYSVEGKQPCLHNIELVRDKLLEEGFEPIVVVDAALRHNVDDAPGYQHMVDNGTLRQAPAGTDADYFILSFARELEARIVSNDRFRDRERSFPEARERIIRYMIVGDGVVLEHRAKRRD
jgi:hypothetical protein